MKALFSLALFSFPILAAFAQEPSCSNFWGKYKNPETNLIMIFGHDQYGDKEDEKNGNTTTSKLLRERIPAHDPSACPKFSGNTYEWTGPNYALHGFQMRPVVAGGFSFNTWTENGGKSFEVGGITHPYGNDLFSGQASYYSEAVCHEGILSIFTQTTYPGDLYYSTEHYSLDTSGAARVVIERMEEIEQFEAVKKK